MKCASTYSAMFLGMFLAIGCADSPNVEQKTSREAGSQAADSTPNDTESQQIALEDEETGVEGESPSLTSQDSESDAAASSAIAESQGTIRIKLSGIRNSDGKLIVCLYRGETGFPSDMNAAWKRMELSIQEGTTQAEFTDVPFGEYALWIAHDENGNGTLDASLIGIPTEGVGVSNNAKGRFGPPAYKDAKFVLDADTHLQEIEITYL